MFPELAYVVLFLPMLIVLVRAAPGPVRAAGGVKRLALAAALLVLAAVPLWVGSTFYVNIATQILLYAIFALGVNVLVGYAGLVTLGHAGLFGVAAYAGARMLNGGHGHVAVAAGALAVTLVAAARLRGARAARHRARLRDDHGGAGPDRLGRRLPVDQHHQRRQRHLHQGTAEPARAVARLAGGASTGPTLLVFLRRRRLDGGASSPRRSARACAARATSRGA